MSETNPVQTLNQNINPVNVISSSRPAHSTLPPAGRLVDNLSPLLFWSALNRLVPPPFTPVGAVSELNCVNPGAPSSVWQPKTPDTPAFAINNSGHAPGWQNPSLIWDVERTQPLLLNWPWSVWPNQIPAADDTVKPIWFSQWATWPALLPIPLYPHFKMLELVSSHLRI